MQKYVNSLIYLFGSLLVLTLVITILDYFNLVGNTFYKISMLFIPIICVCIGGFIIGKNSHAKGYLEGLKLSLILVLLFIIFGLIFKTKFDFTNIIYYIALMTASMLSSMIGINLKKK